MKILIISHNPISTYNNMGKTIKSLFSQFEKEELCQLYIYPSIPDCDVCNSYFQITDIDILRSYYTLGCVGKERSAETSQHLIFQDEEKKKLYQNRNNHLPIKELLRDAMWFFSRWYNKKLKKWLMQEEPTCIFLAPGTSKFISDISLKISKDYKIPIIVYICDDYYFNVNPKGIVAKIVHNQLKNKINKLLQHSSHLITICDGMRIIYSQKFDISSTTIMTGSSIKIRNKPFFRNNLDTIYYFGNIRCNRYHSLLDIGKILDKINDTYKTNYMLKIYSGETDKIILNEINKCSSIKFCGFISSEKVEQLMCSGEIILHVEAFDEFAINMVKYSISTKIADSVASGVPLFAYGPKGIASIDYLLNNKCAEVCTCKELLEEQLLNFISHHEYRKQCVESALLCAENNHNSQKNSLKVKRIIQEILCDDTNSRFIENT